MELIVVCVRDAKSEAFGRPFFSPTIGMAVRSFDDEVNNPESGILHQHPEDFALYALGKFNDASGEFDTEIPKLLMQGNEVKKPLATVHKISKV